MQSKSVTEIRSTGFTKVNRLVRAHRHLDDLRPAFAEWANGDIYVCKKTGDFRYRFGERSKSITVWNKIAREIFATPAEFALAAVVLGVESKAEPEEAVVEMVVTKLTKFEKPATSRANVIALASAAA